MSNRLDEVQNRLGTVRELESVVRAMRGIAATRTREALSRLPGIRACADLIGLAIADAMGIAAQCPSESREPHVTCRHSRLYRHRRRARLRGHLRPTRVPVDDDKDVRGGR